MGLNLSKGNMYDFITHTWNTIKGECYHDCSYCYMKHWGKLNPVRFDEKELKTDLGKDNFIFVGSSNDMFSEFIHENHSDFIIKTLKHCNKYPDNKYFFQTKNPWRIWNYYDYFPENSSFCITVESNRYFEDVMKKSPLPENRIIEFKNYPAHFLNGLQYITIEPIMDFDLIDFVDLLKSCKPKQINIGADSGNNNLPEPPKEKILELITELEKFTKVKQKKNLNRLLK